MSGYVHFLLSNQHYPVNIPHSIYFRLKILWNTLWNIAYKPNCNSPLCRNCLPVERTESECVQYLSTQRQHLPYVHNSCCQWCWLSCTPISCSRSHCISFGWCGWYLFQAQKSPILSHFHIPAGYKLHVHYWCQNHHHTLFPNSQNAAAPPDQHSDQVFQPIGQHGALEDSGHPRQNTITAMKQK